MGLLEDLQKQKAAHTAGKAMENSPMDMHQAEIARHQNSTSEASTAHMEDMRKTQNAMRKAFNYKE